MDLLCGEFDADPRAFLRPIPAPVDAPPAAVAEVMTPRVLTTQETADVADVAELMMSSGVKSVPVARGQQIVGIVSRRDPMAALARCDDHIRADVVAALDDCYPGQIHLERRRPQTASSSSAGAPSGSPR